MLGTYVLRAGYYEAYYGKALRARRKIADDFTAAFASCDAIVTPTSPVPAFKFGERMGDPLQMYLADVLTVGPDLAGVRAVAALRFHQSGVAHRPADDRAGAGRGDLPHRGRLRARTDWHGGCHRKRRVSGVSDYEVVIGLEVHVQPRRSRRSSPSSAAFGAEPNTHTDPVCRSAWALPVLNRAVIDAAVRLGLAVGSKIRQRSLHAQTLLLPRPPEDQISQFDEPICDGGTVKFRLNGEPRAVRLTRIHLEEDAGKNIHADASKSLVDYNRAGVPLCEIVSEPDIRSAEEAAEYVARSARWCATSASATATWRKARSAATRTCRCACAARRRSAPRPRSRT